MFSYHHLLLAFKTPISCFAKFANYVNTMGLTLWIYTFVTIKPLSYQHICKSSHIRISILICKI